jgi:energy-coupling factor transporter ATP-binding protein EcfA2
MPPILEIRQLSIILPDGCHILKDAELSIAKGEIVAIYGPNGCGKSLMIRSILGCADVKISGEIIFKGSHGTFLNNHTGVLWQERDLLNNPRSSLEIIKKESELILLDDPFRGLLLNERNDLLKYLTERKSKNKTTIIFSPVLTGYLAGISDKAYKINNKKIEVTENIPETLKIDSKPVADNNIVLSIENWRLMGTSDTLSFEIKQGEWLGLLGNSNRLFRSIVNPKLKESGNIKVKPSSIGLLYNPVELGWSHRTVMGELETDSINTEIILKQFYPAEKAKQDPFTLSYGEKWLLGLAKLVAIKPSVLLLHGVLDGLDYSNISRTKNIFSTLSPSPGIVYTTCNEKYLI